VYDIPVFVFTEPCMPLEIAGLPLTENRLSALCSACQKIGFHYVTLCTLQRR